ncbi:uncharacterized protein FPRN_00657 [Fusarium proliferatum]|nr:uncharacterized protein FPRN_00657 [Fusarium proliferatum]
MKPSWKCIGPQGRLQGVSQQSLHRPTTKTTYYNQHLMGMMAEHG